MISVQNDGKKLSKEETLDLVAAVTTYTEVAKHFFYVFIYPILTHWKGVIKERYNLKKEEDEIASILMDGYYEEGKWTRLVDFRGETSLFSWMKMTSRQVLFSELKASGEITVLPPRNPSTTRLTLKKLENDEERRFVVGLVKKPKHHRLLLLLHVMMLTDEEAMLRMRITDTDTYTELKKKAEDDLKTRLIKADTLFFRRVVNGKKTTVNLVPLALADMSVLHRDVSFEDSISTIDNQADKEEVPYAPLSDSHVPSSEEWSGQLEAAADEINWWSTMERRIFKERYFHKTPAAVVASQMECRSDYVDVTYSRMHEEFDKYVSNRIKNTNKNQRSASCILRHAIAPQALPMPTNFADFDNACVVMPAHELEMCRMIASIYMNGPVSDDKLMASLKACGVVSQVDPAVYRMVYGRPPKGVFKYVLSSTFVARMALTDHLRELRAFSGMLYQDVAQVEGILTVAIGLTFMKHLFHHSA